MTSLKKNRFILVKLSINIVLTNLRTNLFLFIVVQDVENNLSQFQSFICVDDLLIVLASFHTVIN